MIYDIWYTLSNIIYMCDCMFIDHTHVYIYNVMIIVIIIIISIISYSSDIMINIDT